MEESMASKKDKPSADGSAEPKNLQQLASEYLTMCRVLQLQVNEETLVQLNEDDLQKRIEMLQGAYDDELTHQSEVAELVRLKEVADAKPVLEPVKKLIIKRLDMGSGRMTIKAPDQIKSTGEIIPGIDIAFPDDFKDPRGNCMFHSDLYSFAPTTLNYYGGKEIVLAMVKARIDQELELSPHKFQYISQAQFDAARAEKGVVDRTTKVMQMALTNPEDPEAKKLFAAIAEFEKSHAATGFVQSGPANVGSFEK